jgi:hypothetical protein
MTAFESALQYIFRNSPNNSGIDLTKPDILAGKTRGGLRRHPISKRGLQPAPLQSPSPNFTFGLKTFDRARLIPYRERDLPGFPSTISVVHQRCGSYLAKRGRLLELSKKSCYQRLSRRRWIPRQIHRGTLPIGELPESYFGAVQVKTLLIAAHPKGDRKRVQCSPPRK